MRPFRAQSALPRSAVLPPTPRAHQARLSIAMNRRQVSISRIATISDDSRVQPGVAMPFSSKAVFEAGC